MKYRKKPLIIEAYQTDVELDIETLEGVMHASIGDYIITGINGEKYPCKPDIFEKTYELVEESNYKTTSLEALKKIKEHLTRYNDTDDIRGIDYENEVNIIETALKDYGETDNQLYDLFEKFGINNRKDLLKKLKALEIIKEKVGIHWNELLSLWLRTKLINQEEYDLLKEVLK